MERLLLACLIIALGAACGEDALWGEPSSDVNEYGYALHGEDLYPPMQRRVVAIPCPDHDGAECVSDSDCGPGAACVCRPVHATRNTCIPAECLIDSDCGSAPCFLSIVDDPLADPSRCPRGLYCGRPDSLCTSGGDCPGNGTQCAYVAPSDRFECSNRSCATP